MVKRAKSRKKIYRPAAILLTPQKRFQEVMRKLKVLPLQSTMAVFGKFCSGIIEVYILHDFDNLHTSDLVWHHRTQKNQNKAKNVIKANIKARWVDFGVFIVFSCFLDHLMLGYMGFDYF